MSTSINYVLYYFLTLSLRHLNQSSNLSSVSMRYDIALYSTVKQRVLLLCHCSPVCLTLTSWTSSCCYCIIYQDNRNSPEDRHPTCSNVSDRPPRLSCLSESRSWLLQNATTLILNSIEANSVIEVIDITLTHSLSVYLKQKVIFPLL